MAKSKEERQAELQKLWGMEAGQRYIRKRYLELTGQPLAGMIYAPALISEILTLEFQHANTESAMDVLLTWSGSASHEIAVNLRDWLPEVLPGIAPWVSSEDIAKGKRWTTELHAQLDKTRVSITCITAQNVKSPWVFYEVGYIAAKQAEGIVCPYLVAVDSRLVKDSPIGLFQWTEANKDDTWKLIKSINEQLRTKHDEKLLKGNFDTKWPKLKRVLDKATESLAQIEEAITEVELPIQDRLSTDAKELLLAAAKDQGGRIFDVRHDGGRMIRTNGRNFTDPHSPRLEAQWLEAIEELLGHNLIRNDRGGYSVTNSGFEIADILESRAK